MMSPLPLSGANEGAKRKFFRSHDPYTKYYHPRDNEAPDDGSARKNCRSRPSSACTMYGSAFSPPRGNKRYFVACNSNGFISVWDPRLSSATSSSSRDVDFENSGSLAPILSVRVGANNQVLYDLEFIRTGGGDHLLVASGDPGILIYKWSDFEAAIDARDGGEISSEKPKSQDPRRSEPSSSRRPIVDLRPVTTFRPHPSPVASYGESVEINSTSYSESDGILFGAAGDVFGCYRWDLAAERLLGTFGGATGFHGGGHRDYLHAVKTIPENAGVGSSCVITGGEDGNVGIWNGRDGKLIEMKNTQAVMDKNKDSVASDTTPNGRGFMSTSSTPWSNGSNLWVSSVDANGNWLAVCGGAESANGVAASRSGAGNAGFVTLWHLPTRTFTSGHVTRESLNAVAYNPSLDCFVSGGNEGRVSFWDPTTLARSGRSWSTPPATYTISADPESMVVGGSGGTLDYFMDRVKVSQLQAIY